MARRQMYESTSAVATTRTAASRPIQQTGYFIGRSPSVSSLNVSSGSLSSKKSKATETTNPRENEFDNPMIAPPSPCDTPPRKRWEGAFNVFLRGKNPQHSPTLSSSPSSSITSVPVAEDMSTGTTGSGASHSTIGAGTKGTKKKSSFSLIPGSKRLVSRNLSGKTGSLSSVFSKGSGSNSSSRINRGHKSMDALDIPLRKGLERSRSSALPCCNPDGGSPRQTLTRRQRSAPLTSSAIPIATQTIIHFPSSVAEATETGSLMDSRRAEPVCEQASASAASAISTTPPTFTSALNQQLRKYNNSASGYPSTSNLEPVSSMDCYNNPVVSEGKELSSTLSAPSLTQLHRARSNSRTYIYTSNSNSNSRSNTPVKQFQFSTQEELDVSNIPEMPSLKGMSIYNRLRVPLSDYHDVGLNLDDSDNSHMDDTQQHRQDQLRPSLILEPRNVPKNYGSSHTPPTVITDCGVPEPPETLNEMLGGIGGMVTVHSSSSSHLLSKQGMPASPSTKKAFTKIHNSSEYGKDANSPFLGGRRASNRDLPGAYRSYNINNQFLNGEGRTSQYGSLPRSSMAGFIGGQADQIAEENPISSTTLLSKSLPLNNTLEENSTKTSVRLLKPIQSADSWLQSRRYLIAPAALAASPLTTVQNMTGLPIQSVTEATTSVDPSRTIDLGDAFMTYVGDKYHLSFGKWSSCRLVLRKNYLFEYDYSSPLTSLPRGVAHLQHASAHVQQDFDDALELHFYASPCAKVDRRVLLIRVKDKDERDHWITCLNRAAKLRIEDLWEFQEDRPLGSGRYASIFPARRKLSKTSYSNAEDEDRCDKERSPKDTGRSNVALKIIDKNEFWRLVIKGRERRDTVVRELAVQSTLTAKLGIESSFLQIHGYFETSDHVVIELELLDGKDLFDYISSKGALEEEEAGYIVRDILVALDSMSETGIAHRDIKPANILMTTCDESKYGKSVKIGDFGMATLVGVDGLVRGRCGSPGYVAPEIFEAGPGEGYENRIDVFSAGVTLYLMLCGYEPFYGETEKELIKANKNAELDFPDSEWGRISPEALDLVSQMLTTDPKERITAKGALLHPWIAKLEPSVKSNAKRYSESAQETGVCGVM